MVQYTYSSHRTRKIDKIAKQRVAYPTVAKNIVDTSDIILEVLDTRFLEETRNSELEEEIERQGKKIIYVLNKADLVKPSRLREIKGTLYPYAIVSCTKREGIKDLRNLIKRVAKTVEKRESREILKDKVVESDDGQKRIKVGVIGYPNAGKSSLLNLLAGKSAAGVGADAGFTRNVQKIRLSEEIILVDAPGVIPEDQYSMTDREKIAEHSLAGGKSYTQVKEPDMIVFQLFKKYKKELEDFYKIQAEDSDELIEHVGKEKGFLKKGGAVNENSAAREILRAWQMGEIKVGKTDFELDSKVTEKAELEAEEEQSEEDIELGEIIDELVENDLDIKEKPLRIAQIYAKAHPDRYEAIFKILKGHKENQFDWIDEVEANLELGKEYIIAGNLIKRLKSLNFELKDGIKYLEELENDSLDLLLIKKNFEKITNWNKFTKLTQEKLKENSKCIVTLEEDEEVDEKELRKIAKENNLSCFIGNWKVYTENFETELPNYNIILLEKSDFGDVTTAQ